MHCHNDAAGAMGLVVPQNIITHLVENTSWLTYNYSHLKIALGAVMLALLYFFEGLPLGMVAVCSQRAFLGT